MNEIDETEGLRRERQAELNSQPEITRESLMEQYGQVWTTSEVSNDFTIVGFMAPYVVVRRKADGKSGSLEFTHMPRYYFNFMAD